MNRKITFLYTNIGRGHPYYLDGIVESITRRGQLAMVRRQVDVFEVSNGLARLGWRAVRSLYYRGASDGMFGRLYKGIRGRADYNKSGLTLNTLSGGIKSAILNSPDRVVVAHPTLVAILRGHNDLVYQHGEVVAPDESIVKGASYVLVPTSAVAKSFVTGGYDESRVIVTGLCIELSLARAARESFEARLLRINGQDPLTGAFFSSGAEPKTHVKSLVATAVQATSSGGRAVLFARQGGFFHQYATAKLGESRVQHMSVGSADGLPAELPAALVVLYDSRRELNAFTTSLFRYFDYFVSPSHERTNWALGLGLPMFIVGPCYGPFAPMNRDLLLKSGVADVLDTPVSAVGFGNKLTAMRQHGVLSDMAHAGNGNFDMNGFDRIADFLSANLNKS